MAKFLSLVINVFSLRHANCRFHSTHYFVINYFLWVMIRENVQMGMILLLKFKLLTLIEDSVEVTEMSNYSTVTNGLSMQYLTPPPKYEHSTICLLGVPVSECQVRVSLPGQEEP